MVGSTLNHYRILRELGSGGMGAVYLAEDTKLHREVALKVLPPEVAGDARRRARFEREARAVAALNHPSIVTIHSVEESGDTLFITMEVVAGTSLDRLIPADGLALDRLFELAIPLADAVSAAHRQGVTHRDLKPANIMVTEEGRLKILDFGLAKLRDETTARAGDSQLLTATAEGTIVGTVAYMSPEQAEGRSVDHRSDIFSLGVLLHEMATGRQPFTGATRVSIISSTLKDTPPPVTELNPALPRHLARIVGRCLAKDPARRYQTALDLRNELEMLKEEVDAGEAFPTVAPRPGATRWPLRVATVVLAAAVVALGYGWLSEHRRTVGGDLDVSFEQITFETGQEVSPSLSPDGKMVAYASAAGGHWDVFLQRVGGETPINLTGDFSVDDHQPAFSPDGEFIAFRSERDGGGIFVMGATGESVRRITDDGYNPTWSPDGAEILYATESVAGPGTRTTTSELWVVHVASGERRRVTQGDAVQPHWSPKGHRVAYWAIPTGGAERDVFTVPAAGGDPVRVTDDAAVDWNPVWSPDGMHLYFSSDRAGAMNIWRVPIDERSGRTVGEPEAVTRGATASREQMSFSADGRSMAYVERISERNVYRVAFDPGTETVAGQPAAVTRGSMPKTNPFPSPDGQWLAYSSVGEREDVYVVRTDGRARRQLTNDPHKDRFPRWSPDGSGVAFYSDRSGSYEIWTINADGSELRQVSDEPGRSLGHPIWSPDGSALAYYEFVGEDSYVADLGERLAVGSSRPLPPLPGDAGKFKVWSWSPDGRRLAGRGVRPDGSTTGIFLYSLESGEYRRLTDFGTRPQWLGDGRRLLFASEGSLSVVDSVSGRLREVFSLEPPALVESAFAIAPDGRTIYFTRVVSEADVWMLTLD